MTIEIEIKQDWCKLCGGNRPEPCVMLELGPVGFDCLVESLLSYSDFTEALEKYNYSNTCCKNDIGEDND